MRIAYLTAGAAGMYCGSCMHDNTLAAALLREGVDIQLIPTYTPIRTDEHDVSVDRVFFGGINVYLQQRFAPFRYAPSFLDRVLSHPRLLRWAASRAVSVDPRLLGAMTVSMLNGSHGRQRKEVRRLCGHLAKAVRPNLIVLTNVLIAGCAPELRQRTSASLLATLQGDDIFLDQLPEPFRSQAMERIRRLGAQLDGFLVHTRSYADYMAGYLGLDREKMHVVPLGVDTSDFSDSGAEDPADAPAGERPDKPLAIGYLARLAPEKGLHQLVDAFLRLPTRVAPRPLHLHVAGWLGEHQRAYAEREFQRLRDAGLEDCFTYHGEVDRLGKRDFLRRVDVLSVPTTHPDPKGLYVLEAMAAGKPVVQPHHGAFPELIEATGGGLLTPPGDADALADALACLLLDDQRRRWMAAAGREAVHRHRSAAATARATLEVFRKFAPE